MRCTANLKQVDIFTYKVYLQYIQYWRKYEENKGGDFHSSKDLLFLLNGKKKKKKKKKKQLAWLQARVDTAPCSRHSPPTRKWCVSNLELSRKRKYRGWLGSWNIWTWLWLKMIWLGVNWENKETMDLLEASKTLYCMASRLDAGGAAQMSSKI